MTLSIHIETMLGSEKPAAQQIEEALAAIGFVRETRWASPYSGNIPTCDADGNALSRDEAVQKILDGISTGKIRPSGAEDERTVADVVAATGIDQTIIEPPRPRGRRKASQAPVDAANPTPPQTGVSALNDASGEQPAEPEQQAISTGEERVGPEDPPEVQAQDKADEAAEQATQPAPEKLTVEDLRRALTVYVNTYGAAQAQEDGAKILDNVLGQSPHGPRWKSSEVPEDRLAETIVAIEKAVAENPFNRARI